MRIRLKTGFSRLMQSRARVLCGAVLLPMLAACVTGNAANPLSAQSSGSDTLFVIASLTTGNALERRPLDANGGFALDQWPYAQALGQQWRMVRQKDGANLLMNVASGKAMLATGAYQGLQEANVSGDANLTWQVSYADGSNRAVLTHIATGLCLQATAGIAVVDGAAVGAPVDVAPCDQQPEQMWVVQPVTNVASAGRVFQLTDPASGNLLSTNSNGSLTLGPADGTRDQQWDLITNDDGSTVVQNLATGQSLQSVGTTDSAAAPALSPAAAGQTWHLSGPSGDTFALVQTQSGTCMVGSGTTVTQSACPSVGGWILRAVVASPAPTPTPTSTPTPSPSPSPSNGPIVAALAPWDVDGPSIHDIRQGTTNDCWVLAALSTVVQADPNFIVDHVSVNADGTYTVTLFDADGKPFTHTTGIIASNVAYPPTPSLTLANQPTRANGQPIFWPSLYEQAFLAYAQQNPGIFNTVNDKFLNTGAEVTAYQYITGQSWYFTTYQAAGDAVFWTNLSYANAGIPVAALTKAPGTSTDMFADGILGDHFYAILSTQGTDSDRSVTMRNPWGPRAPAVSDAVSLGDGELRISYSIFVQYFTEIQRANNTSAPP